MASPSPGPVSSAKDDTLSATKRALTPQEKQRSLLSKLLKDPAKPAFIPPPPKEKAIRPPREMMKNVQGSSAGAGSGEFHVYKANRRREYERLKIMEEQVKKETETSEFERKRKEREETMEAKTSKNRAKRLRKKERAKHMGKDGERACQNPATKATGDSGDFPIKKRRLLNDTDVAAMLRRNSHEEGEEVVVEEEEEEEEMNGANVTTPEDKPQSRTSASYVERKITIIDSD